MDGVEYFYVISAWVAVARFVMGLGKGRSGQVFSFSADGRLSSFTARNNG